MYNSILDTNYRNTAHAHPTSFSSHDDDKFTTCYNKTPNVREEVEQIPSQRRSSTGRADKALPIGSLPAW